MNRRLNLLFVAVFLVFQFGVPVVITGYSYLAFVSAMMFVCETLDRKYVHWGRFA